MTESISSKGSQMDLNLINELLHEEESATLDFKRDQYSFDGADDITKSELLKDILAFANAWRRTDAYILIGVEDIRGGRSKPVGVTTHHDDAKLQQFVNSKTNRPIAFAYEATTIDGIQVGIIRIGIQERPFFLKKDYGRLKAGAVYIRRGSSTDTADPAEVHRMGAASAHEEKPPIEEKLKVSLRGHGAGSAAPPFGTGEPMHLAIELTIVNDGHSPVFVVSANLKDVSGTRSISFAEVCNENEPLQPGGRRKATQKLLYHDVFPAGPYAEHRREQLKEVNRFTFTLLRFICQEGSTFQIETGRGNVLTFPTADVCDHSFLGWPFVAAPSYIEEEFCGKSLQDLERKWPTQPPESPSSGDVEVLSLYYQDVKSDPYSCPVITSCPRRYHAELGITNVSTNPLHIKSISLTVGTQTYGQDEEEAIRIEPHEYKEVDTTFPANETAPSSSGEFELEVSPAIGMPIKVRGTFPLTAEKHMTRSQS